MGSDAVRERGLLPREFLEEIGRMKDPALEDEVHRAEVGRSEFVLRRDCHGALRKVEVRFPAEAREAVRANVARIAALQVVVPGTLEIADVSALGKLYLLADQLNATLRLEPERGRVVELLDAVVVA